RMRLTLRSRIVESLLGCRSERRNSPIRRIRDERGSRNGYDPGVRIPPFAAVGTSKIGGRAAAAIVAIHSFERPPGVLLRLLWRQIFLPGKLGKPFQRRQRRVGPDALQVRLAIRRTGQRPTLRTNRRRADGRTRLAAE